MQEFLNFHYHFIVKERPWETKETPQQEKGSTTEDQKEIRWIEDI